MRLTIRTGLLYFYAWQLPVNVGKMEVLSAKGSKNSTKENMHMETAIKKKASSTKEMALIGVMTAVTCVAAPFAIPIPISPVPITLTTLILYLSIYILGARKSLISYVVYLAIGLMGLPVFSGFSGGFGKLAGPTGGYLIGFLFMLPLTGMLFETVAKNIGLRILALAFGTLIAYLFGTVWICLQLHLDFISGLWLGGIPYLPGDIVKIILAAIVGPVIAKAVKRAV